MSWFENFKSCMHSNYNIDVPDSVGQALVDATAAAAAAEAIVKTLESYGTAVTVGELMGAGLAVEIADYVVALVAALGVGAVIGAFMACGVIDQLI